MVVDIRNVSRDSDKDHGGTLDEEELESDFFSESFITCPICEEPMHYLDKGLDGSFHARDCNGHELILRTRRIEN